MKYDNITTPDDFEKLSEDEKIDFKTNYSLSYQKVFLSTSAPAFDWKKHTKELNFYPSDIKTPDDFEALTPAGKQYLKEEFSLQYKEIFTTKK